MVRGGAAGGGRAWPRASLVAGPGAARGAGAAAARRPYAGAGGALGRGTRRAALGGHSRGASRRRGRVVRGRGDPGRRVAAVPIRLGTRTLLLDSFRGNTGGR